MISAIVGSQLEQPRLIAACTALIRLHDEMAGVCNRNFDFFTENLCRPFMPDDITQTNCIVQVIL